MLEVRAPASTSNLGSGFDCFGLALQLYLSLRIHSGSATQEINVTGEGATQIPADERNLVITSMQKLYDRIGQSMPPLSISIHNEIPLLRGLGSSGAATVAGLVAANKLSEAGISSADLLDLAAEMEGHPENASATLYGGLTINCTEGKHILCRKTTVDDRLQAVLLIPDKPISTQEARKVLPAMVPHTDAVFNLQRSAMLLHALQTKDYSPLKAGMQDRLHQPFRQKLIPGYEEFAKCGAEAGALGVCISGSGSTILGLALDTAEAVARSWSDKSAELGVKATVRTVAIDQDGVRVTG